MTTTAVKPTMSASSDPARGPAEVTADVVARLGEAASGIRAGVAAQEVDRRLSDETFELIRGTGALRVAVPREHGGTETSLRSMIEVAAAVAEIDGSAGWVTTLANNAVWGLVLFPQAVRDEFWSDPLASGCGVFAPSGQARPVAGGYRVSGSWPYGSGSLHATVAMLGVTLLDDSGKPAGIHLAAVPRADYRVEDTWHVVGMRGSGSNTIVVDDIFVPAERVVPFGRMQDPAVIEEFPDNPLYRVSFVPMSVLTIAGPLLGLARAALDFVVQKASTKTIAYTFFPHQEDSVGFQLEVARAAAEIDTAHLHLMRSVDDLDGFAARGEWPTEAVRARLRSDAAVASESVVAAVSRLMFAHGTGSFATVSPLQQIWRDLNTGARHAILTPSVGRELYGESLLGLKNAVTPLF